MFFVFYFKICINKVKKFMCDCKYSDGIYIVFIFVEEYWNVLCVLCKYIVGYFIVFFLLVLLIMLIIINLFF